MATDKQIAANRRNAKKSTGPRTEQGKLHSRTNAFRHGLTAETVIKFIENADEYTAFEKAIVADYGPQTTIEHHLVVRLASLLWRLRRAVAIESGLFQIQGQILYDRRVRDQRELSKHPLKVFRDLLKQSKPIEWQSKLGLVGTQGPAKQDDQSTMPARPPEISHSFLRLANLDGEVLERIGRYEVGLWRQAAQTVLILNSYCKTQGFFRAAHWNLHSRGLNQR
jgi:hypothetical protein